MAEIILNGKTEPFPGPVSLSDFFQSKNLSSGKVAAELNGTIIPADKFNETILNSGDRLEVIRIVGGG